MSDLPTTYAQQDTVADNNTNTKTVMDNLQINVNADYVKTIPGMFKCAEVGLSFITFICSVVYPRYAGDGFVDFVTMSAFLTILIDLILNILSLRGKLPNISNIVMFVVYCLFTVFYFAAAIVASVKGHYHSSIAATAFFAFICTAVFGADSFLQLRMLQSGDSAGVSMTTTTTTTTTEQNFSQPTDVKVQY